MEYQSPLSTIAKVGEYLSEPLPYLNRIALKAHLAGLDSLGLEVAEKRVDWLKMLHDAENKMLYPKDKEMTELDRRIKLQAAVADIRRDHDYLVALEELINRRLDLGKILLTEA